MPAEERNIQPPQTLGPSILILGYSLSILPSRAALLAEPAEGRPHVRAASSRKPKMSAAMPAVHGSLQHPSLIPAQVPVSTSLGCVLSICPHASFGGWGRDLRVEQKQVCTSPGLWTLDPPPASEPSIVKVCEHPSPAWVLGWVWRSPQPLSSLTIWGGASTEVITVNEALGPALFRCLSALLPRCSQKQGCRGTQGRQPPATRT